jgi:hypothetical protein
MIYRTDGPGMSNNPNAARRKRAIVVRAGITTSSSITFQGDSACW